MKNVKVILTGVALCATLFATNQRIHALGGDSGFWPNDKDNINYFPSSINDHGFVEVDGVGTAGGTGDVSATVLFGDDTKWGFSYDEADSDSWFNLMWGSGDMGIKGGLVSSSDGDDDTDDASGFNFAYGQRFSWGELGVGLVSGAHNEDGDFNNDQMDYWLNWRGDLGFWIFDQSKASLMMTDDGDDGTSMGLGFDMFTHMDAGGADVLFGMGFGYQSNSWGDATAAAQIGTASADAYCTLGGVDNDAVSAWDCATLGGTYTDAVEESADYEAAVEDREGGTATVMHLPAVNLAVEADITDWATFRCFVNTDYTVSSSNDGDGGVDGNGYAMDGHTGASTSYGMGLGFNWGGLTADMSISENLLQDPISYMTGYSGESLTNYGVTLTYSF